MRVLVDIVRSTPQRRSEVWAGVAVGVKALGLVWLGAVAAGATGDLATALFVVVGYSAVLVCASAPRQSHPMRVHDNSQIDNP